MPPDNGKREDITQIIYESSIILMSKLDKDIISKKQYRSTFLMNTENKTQF